METTDDTATVKLRRREVRNINVLIAPPVIHIALDAMQTEIKNGLGFFAPRHLEPTVSQFRQSKNPNILETNRLVFAKTTRATADNHNRRFR